MMLKLSIHSQSLPEEDEYKPHLNIRCLSVDSIGRQMLIGSYTIKSISDYYKDLHQLKALYKNCKLRVYFLSLQLLEIVSLNHCSGFKIHPKFTDTVSACRRTLTMAAI